MPESLEQLDLLLLTVAQTRRVRRDGIHFQTLCYLDPMLAAYVGEELVIRYDPRDMAEIRVYHNNRFLCRAVCQELASQTVSLKEIVQARNQRRRALQQAIKDRAELIQTYLKIHQEEREPPPPSSQIEPPIPPVRRLKLYEHE
jgi:putative transposase